MTSPSQYAEIGASASEMLRLLRWLARPGARATSTGHSSVRFARARAAGLAVLGEVSLASWQAAVQAGLAASDGASGEWRLTRAGRTQLKRLLSRCEQQPATSGTARQAGSAATQGRPDVNLAESPLAWLRRRRDKGGAAMIGDAEFHAGERLRADFWFAGLTPRVTTNWSPAGSGGRAAPGLGLELKDNIVAARERVHRALAAVGPELAGVLIDVCCHLKGLEEAERQAGWPARSGKVVLQLALQRLARHYGLIRDEDANRAPRPRHWGTPDYRPKLEGGS